MRTEQDILKNFEALGYEVKNKNSKLTLFKWLSHFSEYYEVIDINKYEKTYGKAIRKIELKCGVFTMQEHKLLNELFTIWGWL